jgi:hypothetical protein
MGIGYFNYQFTSDIKLMDTIGSCIVLSVNVLGADFPFFAACIFA